MNDIIVALATPLQNASRGVLRLSGLGCHNLVLNQVASVDHQGRVRRARFKKPFKNVPAYLYLFSQGSSYSTQEMIEVHLPGNPHVLVAIKNHFVSLGARQADPGEFTRRAVQGGRLNLEQAQAVLHLIQARSEQEHSQALKTLCREGQDALQKFQTFVHQSLMEIENELDFDDEDTGLLPENYFDSLLLKINQSWQELRASASGENLPYVVLWGRANAGKSTLFNALGGRALTSAHAGTTRDYLEASFEWEGLRFILVDTPGHDGPEGEPDLIAKRLAQEVSKKATFVVKLGRLKDREPNLDWYTCADEVSDPWPENSLSLHQSHGLSSFRRWLKERLLSYSPLRFFNKEHIHKIEDHLSIMNQESSSWDGVIWSTHLRELSRQLDPLDTQVHPDDVLNDLFSRFCVGK